MVNGGDFKNGSNFLCKTLHIRYFAIIPCKGNIKDVIVLPLVATFELFMS